MKPVVLTAEAFRQARWDLERWAYQPARLIMDRALFDALLHYARGTVTLSLHKRDRVITVEMQKEGVAWAILVAVDENGNDAREHVTEDDLTYLSMRADRGEDETGIE